MKKFLIALAAMTTFSAPALADPPRHAPAWGHAKHDRHHDRFDRYDRRDRDYYRAARYDHRHDWRGRDRDDRRYGSYCRRDSNAEGTVVGAVAGGVLGNVIAPRGSKTLGTVIGAGLGGVVGHEVDKGDRVRRKC